jgi:gliding motility-associated-like protein
VYTVTLIAYNGSASSTATHTITVYPAPTVSFNANDTSVCPGTPVTFTSTTIPGVAGSLSYVWNFGDGVTSSAGSPSHVFPGPGFYNITLFATNAQGCQSSLTEPGLIHVFTPPVATFTTATSYFCNPPGADVFTPSVTGTPGFTYNWTFGDGATGTGASPSHTYSATGTYSVGLIVTDGHGCKDTINAPGDVTVANLSAAFNSVPTACVYSWVMFHNTSSTFTSCTWNFGDGGTSTLDSPSHFYTVPGTYTVTMVISSGPCHDTVTHTIIITPGPAMTITPSPVNACPAPVGVTFSGGGVPAGSTVSWLFGDGGTGSGNPATHTFSGDGCFYVSMLVTQENGCKDTVKMVDTIHPIFPTVIDSPFAGCVPLTVPFALTLTTTACDTYTLPYPFAVTTYSWNFGDGSALSTSPSPSHTYTATGVYHGTVHFTTANGCSGMDTFTIYVGTPPVASFYATPTHICADQWVNFISTSTGAITSWSWTFGDGGSQTDTVGTTSHHYTVPGIFSVTLIVYDNGCPSLPFTITNYITVDSPQALFTDSFVCVPPTSIGFENYSLGATSWTWSFGDGSTSTLWSPVHSYSALGTYDVSLITYNFRSGCHDTMNMVIDLFHPTVTFTADDTAICKYNSVLLTPTVTGGTASNYSWYVDGILTHYPVGPPMRDTFWVPGIYTVSLVITDQHGCRDTFTRDNYIIVAKPIDSFSAAPPNGCWPLSVTLTDHSTDVPGAFPVSYAWTFGDGATGTGSPAAHTYTAAGTFGVTEIVTDNIGCKDTITKPGLITVTRPHAAFAANKTAPCIGDSVQFTNLSVGIVSCVWLFGDGDSANTTNASHAYLTTGSFTVKLAVVDANGCVDTAVYLNYINVTRPNASFYNTDSFTICLPLSCHFVNTSSGAVSYHWSFGNGDSSVVFSPSELYVAAALDTVFLVATNVFGCRDTAIGHVNVYGYAGAFSYNPDTGCAPLAIHFDAGLINVPSVIWDFDDGMVSSSSSLDTITHIYTVPGRYIPKLILSDNTGCQNSSLGTDTIKVDMVYPGFLEHPFPICVGETVSFTDTSRSYFSTVSGWNWQFCDTCFSSLQNPTHQFDSIGNQTIMLTATDAWGCTNTISENINVLPPPRIGVNGDTVICVGDYATLYAFGGVSYTWGPAASLSCTACNPTQASPTAVTQYTVTGTDAYGCVATDTVTVFLRTKTTSVAGGGDSVCQGTPVQLYDSGATKFTWIPSNGLNHSNISDPVATPPTTTTYEVIAQLGNCIPDTNYVSVIVYPLPTIHASGSQVIVDGASANITSSGSNIAGIGWSPAATLSCDSCYDPVATPPGTTTYYVQVHSPFGCLAGDSVTIKVVCDDSQIFIPNSFTPNGDGNNDVFYPRGSGVSQVKSFRIYNRWGELLFEKDNFELNDIGSAWNGSYNGAPPRPDVYVYVLDATCNNGQPLFIKGDVTIIK